MRLLRLRRQLRRLLERHRDARMHGARLWLALDLWQALGYDPHSFDAFVREVGFDEAWALLLDEARVSQSFKQQISQEG